MTNKRKLSLFVFIDAFGWELAQRIPFMDDVLTTKAPLDTIFGYSSTCDPTIFTGTMPRDHGHFAFFYYNPAQSPFKRFRWLSLIPKSITSRGRVRNQISRFAQHILGYTGYFQLYNMPFQKLHMFDYSEKRSLFEPGGINGGQRTIFDILRDESVQHVLGNDWTASEEKNIRTVTGAIAAGNVSFAYLFLGKLDALLHAHPADSPNVVARIRWYEAQLERLLKVADQKYETVRLFVFSDHGMTGVHDTCDLAGRVEATGLRFGEDYAAVYDSTMARFWFLREGARERVEAVLSQEPRGHVMRQEELARYGCDFSDQKYGQLFFLMNPGVLICPSFMGERPLAGMHGYAPEDAHSIATFMTNVSGPPKPKRLEDLYSIMLAEARSE